MCVHKTLSLLGNYKTKQNVILPSDAVIPAFSFIFSLDVVPGVMLGGTRSMQGGGPTSVTPPRHLLTHTSRLITHLIPTTNIALPITVLSS